MVHVDLCSFYVAVFMDLKAMRCFVRLLTKSAGSLLFVLALKFACWSSAALSSVRYFLEVRANVQIFYFLSAV